MRSMGESLTQYIKKKKGGKPNNSGDTPRRETRSEVGSEGKAAPSPGHRRSNLQPDTQHGKQGGGGPLPLPGLVSGGVGYRAGLCFPRGWLRTGALTTPPTGSAPSHSSGVCPSLTSKALAMTGGGGALQLLEKGCVPSQRGGDRRWGQRIHSCGKGREPGRSVSHPGCPPKWQRWGAAPQQA